MTPLVFDDSIIQAAEANDPFAAGVSGGKDSCGLGYAVDEWLTSIGHTGKRLLIHADLGLVEWADSLPTCERLAKAIGWELQVVTRKAGGMMERWESRWEANLQRYVNLECVKLILPWSTPSMRFCTAELKRDVICAALVKRWPGCRIISASGIRRDESNDRKNAPITKPEPKMLRKKIVGHGINWNPLLAWTKADIFAYLKAKKFRLHEAYALGSSRVSCAFCIMSNASDLHISSRVPAHADLLRRMIALETKSTFAFQSSGWLGDVGSHVLSCEELTRFNNAKFKAEWREKIEARIPKELYYVKGWPTRLPTPAEADTLAEVRAEMALILKVEVKYVTGESVIARYQELMDAQRAKA